MQVISTLINPIEEVPWLVENIYKLVLSNDSSQSPRPDKFDCSNVKYKDKVSEILEGSLKISIGWKSTRTTWFIMQKWSFLQIHIKGIY